MNLKPLLITLLIGWTGCALSQAIPSETELWFSPRGGVAAADVDLINQSKSEVLVMAYAFNSEPIIHALIEAKKRGCVVKVILDRNWQVNASRAKTQLTEAGIIPLIDRAHRIQHQKVIISDRSVVRTGSANFTTEADGSHSENAIWLRDPRIVARFVGNFNTHAYHAGKGIPRLLAKLEPTPADIAKARLMPSLLPVSDGTPNGYLYIQGGDWSKEFVCGGIRYKLTIPDGFISDGTSIPRWAVSLAGIERDGLERLASWVHDYLYKHLGKCEKLMEKKGAAFIDSKKVFTRSDADSIFRDLLLESGVTAVRADEMFIAVRTFGGSSWDSHK